MSSILTKVKDAYVGIRGFHTNRKLVVIESDDWGSIRMPSKETFDLLVSLGDHPQTDAFLRNDCLENQDDLTELFKTLCSVKDSKGNPAVVTANFATANPKFEEIDYQTGTYRFETFVDTYKRYYGENTILDQLKHGDALGCFKPQLHCREHMNVSFWMKCLQEQRADTILAFENKMIGVGNSFFENNPFGYMDAFNSSHTTDATLSDILSDAHEIFQKTFGYPSETFVASCYVWNDALEQSLCELGIRFIQSYSWQNYPVMKNGKPQYKRKIHFTGEKNKLGQIYSVRNCMYEPAFKQNPASCVNSCFDAVKRSFAQKKPAIICSHRLNYIGSINPENRTRNLTGLQKLLEKIVSEFPDVEFVSSPELFAIMQEEHV